MKEKIRVLFVCTANAARSQMAEGLLRAKYGDRYEVFSAGTRQSKVSTRAVTVMQEIGRYLATPLKNPCRIWRDHLRSCRNPV